MKRTAETPSPRARPRFARTPRSTDRALGGVAAGWAERWGVDPTLVRALIALLALLGGVGVVLYGLGAWWSAPPDPDAHRPVFDDRRRDIAIVTAAAAIVIACRTVGLWPGDAVILPAALAAIGLVVVWRPRDGDLHAATPRRYHVLRAATGAVLVGAGVVSLANRTGGLASFGASAAAIAVVVAGLAMFGAPALGRLFSSLDEERSGRIRDEERAKLAAHLHDSVLQSLVLIQRSPDARHMAGLARRQERELRAWLYGDTPTGAPTTLHAAVEAMTNEIESDHLVRVEAVIVGDQPLDDAALMLVAALREAIVNAARHADVEQVDVFVEADETELSGFVRDTGKGFDPAVIPDDRHGIRDSIRGRVSRVGGTATLTSEPGAGTEVEIRIPRRRLP